MADPKDTADALVEEGLQLYKAGHLDDALDKWVAALDLVEDHKQALEYYAYVERNRDALEESFQQAADYTGDKLEMSDGAADDADVEFERERASFAGGQATPLPDGHGNYKPESHIQDPAQLQSLGEDDATPIVELPREEKTSRIGREELEVHLDESRKAEEIAAAAAKNFSTQEPTPEVGGLPHILLEEAAEDEEGSHTGSGSQIELATRGIGGNMATGASKPPDDDDDELVLLSDDDDYASEMDIAEDGPEFTWEEEASVKADGGAPPQGLQIDLSPDSSEEEALEVEDSSVVKSSPSDLLDFGENPSFKEDSGYQEVLLGGDMETSGSAPDIPELPNIPVSTPFEGLQDSSEDKSWVKEELERVDTAQGLNKAMGPSPICR